jgi:hypothetical protein
MYMKTNVLIWVLAVWDGDDFGCFESECML